MTYISLRQSMAHHHMPGKINQPFVMAQLVLTCMKHTGEQTLDKVAKPQDSPLVAFRDVYMDFKMKSECLR